MPCRPKLCQRFAAQLSHPPPSTTPNSSRSHIWISDDLLSDAFSRYVRVSHASRRYGSNVPGPLEARKRASRRRMGMAVASAGAIPPGGDFGALFGAGGSGGGNTIENGWTWTAPGKQQNSPVPAKEDSNVWGWRSKSKTLAPPAPWEQMLEISEVEDTVKASREAFEALLDSCRHQRKREDALRIEADDIAPMLQFLSSSVDEPAAHNTNRLIQWIGEGGGSASAEAWRAISDLISDKIQLATLETEELPEITRNLSRSIPWQQDDEARQQLHATNVAFWTNLGKRSGSDILACHAPLEELVKLARTFQDFLRIFDLMLGAAKSDALGPITSKIISTATLRISDVGRDDNDFKVVLRKLALELAEIPPMTIAKILGAFTTNMLQFGPETGSEHVRRTAQEIKDVRQEGVLRWLQCLKANPSFSQFHMDVVYAKLAKHYHPSQLAEHFATMEPVEIVRLLLRTWLPSMDLERLRRDYGVASTSRKGLCKLQPGLEDLFAADLARVLNEFERLNDDWRYNWPWRTLFEAFARSNVQYDHIALEAVRIWCKIMSPKELHSVFKRVLGGPYVVMPKSAAVELVSHFIQVREPFRALEIFNSVPSLAVTDVPGLHLALIEAHGGAHGFLLELLQRQPHRVPPEERSTHKLNIADPHAEVIQLIAHDIANAPLIRPNIAYHHVWAYYRWLQDRGATLTPLISRAFVQVGILRFLRERLWIPDERLAYILSIVEKVEGADARAQVERLATQLRSSVHEEVLSKRQARAHSAWANEAQARAEGVRFRAKKWSRRKGATF